jgi:hypothetical protein
MRAPRLTRFASLATLVAFVLAAGTVAAQALRADFSGSWKVMVEGPEGPLPSTLTLAQTADSVAGKFESQVGSADVRGAVKGDSLSLAFVLDVNGQMIDLQGSGALKEPHRMDGKITAVGMGEFPFSATREPR